MTPPQRDGRPLDVAERDRSLTRQFLGSRYHPGGRKLTREMGELLGLTAQARVLDLACGSGDTAILLHEQYSCQVIGIDPLIENVRASREAWEQKLSGAKHTPSDHVHPLGSDSDRQKQVDTPSPVQFEHQQGDAFPLDDLSVDAIICESALSLAEDPARLLSECLRVLKRGGRIALCEATRNSELPEELDPALASALLLSEAHQGAVWTTLVQDAGFVAVTTRDESWGIVELVDRLMDRFRTAQRFMGNSTSHMPRWLKSIDKQLEVAKAAVSAGTIGCVVITAKRP